MDARISLLNGNSNNPKIIYLANQTHQHGKSPSTLQNFKLRGRAT